MTALAIERKTPKLGQDTLPSFPTNQPLPIAASTKIYTGAMVALATTGANAGNLVQGQAATGLIALGVAEQTYDNSAGAAGALTMVPRQGVYLMNVGSGNDAISATNVGQDCYMIDDNTVGLTNGGGARSRAGVIVAVDSGTPPFSQPTGVWVLIGITGQLAALSEDPALQFKARNLVTSLAAYTGTGTNVLTASANGALGAQDGVTNAAGDVIFIQAGTTNLTGALDSGPWVVTSAGGASAKYVLTRPAWFQTGEAVPNGCVIEVDGEGTNYAGSSWKAFCAQGTVIGTTDPAFYIREFVSAVTLVTGFSKLGPSQTFPGLRSTTQTDITFTPTNFNGAGSTVSYRTGVYASGGSATAAGYMGTSTVSITALIAAGTFNTSDIGTGLLTIRNW